MRDRHQSRGDALAFAVGCLDAGNGVEEIVRALTDVGWSVPECRIIVAQAAMRRRAAIVRHHRMHDRRPNRRDPLSPVLDYKTDYKKYDSKHMGIGMSPWRQGVAALSWEIDRFVTRPTTTVMSWAEARGPFQTVNRPSKLLMIGISIIVFPFLVNMITSPDPEPTQNAIGQTSMRTDDDTSGASICCFASSTLLGAVFVGGAFFARIDEPDFV